MVSFAVAMRVAHCPVDYVTPTGPGCALRKEGNPVWL